MVPHIPSHLSDLPIYKKAVEIIVLSRSISTYINQDLCYLSNDGIEDSNIYFSGDIVQQSTSIAPEIIKAEQERFSEKKHKHIASVRALTNRLYQNCKRLENCNSNGKDFIPLLRRELRTFKKLQRSWLLTL
ncbi:hypothetical protein IA57_08540 [Mangrovimonas yunxiaonensis]|uniref:Four helix bundle protein n=1 Tax=Mangrovimonas yunxiaonensis TaxID=1197477 RepID=A0A084TIH8_9FLAO|nr:hypothetical protein [Mangrovimonas yunxiaonensis]KFB00514.1 hypothetical protein IA57_08540 [Mangrovimonas yunxiaonensis]MBR9757185.1 hypothetical protein [Algicola sp.]GGH47415.1 hypothetical protein GCM10011364_22250 [Mangrovimonas yunxiaonensis]